jgi:hypothetical protein
MKKLLAISSAAMFLSACGVQNTADQSQGSDLASTRNFSQSYFADDIKIVVVNDGINPMAFAYNVTAKIQTGGNLCMASGVRAFTRQFIANGELHVMPMVSTPPEAALRLCTREFMPQFATVEFQIRGTNQHVSNVVFRNIGGLGSSKNVTELLTPVDVEGSEVVVTNVRITKTQGDINAGDFAHSIKANVKLGTNPCFASDVKVELRSVREGDAMVVRAVRTGGDPNRICTMEFNPVYGEIETVVSGSGEEIKTIKILNVDQHGNEMIHSIR